MKIPSSGCMANSGEGEKKVINSELWHACAGPLVSLPPVGSLVVYFPQGHSEQVAASMRKESDGIPSYPNLPSKLICMLRNVTLHADGETDEVYAQMTLQPASKYEQEALLVSEMGLKHSRQPSEFFCKTLTASDTSTHGGFSVPRRAAEKIFPPLDFSMQPPAQELVARDLHDQTWTFRHIYRGQPKRHLLTSGWSVFVNSKRLVAGDAVLFIRDERSQLLLGTRRANRQQPISSSSVISSDSMHIGILAAAAHAAANNTQFTVFYNPRACPSEFVIPLAKYNKAMYTHVASGVRFRMMFETEDSGVRRYMGTVNSVSDMDPVRWKNSLWRNLQVGWDESTAGERPNRVSIWEIEPVMAPLYMCPPPFFRPNFPKGFPDDLSSKDASSSLFPALSLVQWMNMQQQHNHHLLPNNNQSSAVMREPNNLHSNDRIQQPMANQNPQQLHPNESSFQQHTEQQQQLQFHQQQVLLQKQQHNNNALEPQTNHKLQPQQNHKTPRLSESNHVNASESQTNQNYQPQQNNQTSFLSGSNHIQSSQFLDNRFLVRQRSPVMDRVHSIRADVDIPSCSSSPSKNNMQVEQTNFVRNQPGLVDDLIVQETNNSNPDNQIQHELPNSKSQEHHKKYKGGAVIDHLDATSAFGGFPMTGFDDVQSHTRNSAAYTSTVEGWGPDVLLSGGYDPGKDMHNLVSNYNGTDVFQTDLSSGTHSLEVPTTMPFNPGPSNDVVNELGDVNVGFWTNQTQRVRTYTKVQKRGSVGRTIDVTRYKGYDELRHDLARMFGMEGLLEDPIVQAEWKLVYVDHENDILLVGDDPWEEFVTCVQSIKILSSAEVQQMSLDGDLGQMGTVQNPACSLTDSGNAWRGQYDNSSAASFNR